MHIAMENGPFLDDLPIENGDSIAMLFYRTVLIYQEGIFSSQVILHWFLAS